jgi:hypothetical protein
MIANIFRFANAKKSKEIMKDTPNKNIVICKSRLGPPKNIIFVFTIFTEYLTSVY